MPFSTAPGIKDEEALGLLVAESGAGADDIVLDVACGPGLVVAAFAGVVRHATGIDITPAMLERARDLARERGLTNVRWDHGDVIPLPYADGAFSIVSSRFAFHHFLDPAAVLAEMRRVCAHGGTIVVTDLLASSDPAKAAAFNRMEVLRDPSHVRALPLAELEALLRDAGLTLRRRVFYQLASEIEKLLERSFPAPGDADRIRALFAASLDDDGLGLDARRHGATEIRFAYPIAILVADVP
ncbi:MAG: methyltransferase domain-containing protein [Deltaproteobacteria bacterium]|nr:methyltransferase domain-containing protein [Deltaproteobacteria bacterium]